MEQNIDERLTEITFLEKELSKGQIWISSQKEKQEAKLELLEKQHKCFEQEKEQYQKYVHKQRDLLLSRTEMVQNQEKKLVEKIFQLQEEARKLHNKKDKLQSSYDLWKTKKNQHEQIMEQQKLQIERREKELDKKRKDLQERELKIQEKEEKIRNQPPIQDFRKQVMDDYVALKREYEQAKSLHLCLNDFRQVLTKQHQNLQKKEENLKYHQNEFEEEKDETCIFYQTLAIAAKENENQPRRHSTGHCKNNKKENDFMYKSQKENIQKEKLKFKDIKQKETEKLKDIQNKLKKKENFLKEKKSQLQEVIKNFEIEKVEFELEKRAFLLQQKGSPQPMKERNKQHDALQTVQKELTQERANLEKSFQEKNKHVESLLTQVREDKNKMNKNYEALEQAKVKLQQKEKFLDEKETTLKLQLSSAYVRQSYDDSIMKIDQLEHVVDKLKEKVVELMDNDWKRKYDKLRQKMKLQQHIFETKNPSRQSLLKLKTHAYHHDNSFCRKKKENNNSHNNIIDHDITSSHHRHHTTHKILDNDDCIINLNLSSTQVSSIGNDEAKYPHSEDNIHFRNRQGNIYPPPLNHTHLQINNIKKNSSCPILSSMAHYDHRQHSQHHHDKISTPHKSLDHFNDVVDLHHRTHPDHVSHHHHHHHHEQLSEIRTPQAPILPPFQPLTSSIFDSTVATQTPPTSSRSLQHIQNFHAPNFNNDSFNSSRVTVFSQTPPTSTRHIQNRHTLDFNNDSFNSSRLFPDLHENINSKSLLFPDLPDENSKTIQKMEILEEEAFEDSRMSISHLSTTEKKEEEIKIGSEKEKKQEVSRLQGSCESFEKYCQSSNDSHLQNGFEFRSASPFAYSSENFYVKWPNVDRTF